MTVHQLNHLDADAKREALWKCNGSTAWVERICAIFPFESKEQLIHESEMIWFGLKESDWLEAFAHHPKIGDLDSIRQKFAATASLAEGEQSAVKAASEKVITELAEGNKRYEQKFGFIFIVFATGKSAEEMLSILQERLENNYQQEIGNAVQEQNKITKLRLEKLLT